MSWENPFQSPGRFWRGNIHTHSTASDGCLSPEAVCAVYKNAGYDFLCISDHFMERFGYPLTDATRFDTETFVTIRGAELHAGRIESGEPWHLLGIGLPADFAPPSPGESGPSMAARALAAGAFVAAAHPSWYRAGQEEIESLGPIHAIETWNATSAGLNDRPDSWYLLDRLVGAGGRYTACAGDDAHFTRERDDAAIGMKSFRPEMARLAQMALMMDTSDMTVAAGPIQATDIQPPARSLAELLASHVTILSGESRLKPTR